MQNASLFEAIWMWLNGQKLDGYAIYGLPTVWISRFAKIATFVGGITVVLDLIGSERLAVYGARLREQAKSRRSRLGTKISIVLLVSVLPTMFIYHSYRLAIELRGPEVAFRLLVFFIVLATVIIAPMFFSILGGPFVVEQLGRIFQRPRRQRFIRWSAFWLISVAFLLDLLTS